MPDRPAGLRGLTWDHPRGYQALEAFGAATAGTEVPRVHWSRQPLAGFEAHPIDELARTYDLLVIDHPGLGAAIAADALVPIDELLPGESVLRLARETVATAWHSYRLHGRSWAVPIDAATQVALARRALVPRLPARWRDVEALAREVPMTLCLGGPHALLMLLALGGDRSSDSGRLLDPARAVGAVELLQRLAPLADADTSMLDPIGVHEAIADGSGPAWCPLAFGYATYADRGLAWADAPAWLDDSPASVLGGTGLAVAARSRDDERVMCWLQAFLEPSVQAGLVPDNGGQPALRAIWQPGAVDDRWGHYYTATRRSLDKAWIRPRLPGWIMLQDEAGSIVRDALRSAVTAQTVVDELNRMYTALLRTAQAAARPETTKERL